LVRDDSLSLRDIQTILGHAQLATTQIYLEDDDIEVFRRIRQHLASRENAAHKTPPLVADGYDAADLAVLFGGTVQ